VLGIKDVVHERFVVSRRMKKPMFGWVLVYRLATSVAPPSEDERDCEVRQ